MTSDSPDYVAFTGNTLIGRGPIEEIASLCKTRIDAGETARVAIFDNHTGRPLDIDFRGSSEQMLASLAVHPVLDAGTRPAARPAARPAGRGRPKMGVVSREVSLLPRHWEWLSNQRGGASAALRRLVDSERKNRSADQIIQTSIEATHRFMWDMAGNKAGFESASRALFARDFSAFEQLIERWPEDIRKQLLHYLKAAQAAIAASPA